MEVLRGRKGERGKGQGQGKGSGEGSRSLPRNTIPFSSPCQRSERSKTLPNKLTHLGCKYIPLLFSRENFFASKIQKKRYIFTYNNQCCICTWILFRDLTCISPLTPGLHKKTPRCLRGTQKKTKSSHASIPHTPPENPDDEQLIIGHPFLRELSPDEGGVLVALFEHGVPHPRQIAIFFAFTRREWHFSKLKVDKSGPDGGSGTIGDDAVRPTKEKRREEKGVDQTNPVPKRSG